MNDVGKLVRVTWIDACDQTEKLISYVKRKGSRYFMVERKTFGEIIVHDKDGIVIIRDIDEDKECEIVAIPAVFVKDIEYYEKIKNI